jgi:transposase
MYYTGCDAHRKRCTLQHIDEEGALGLMMTIPNNSQGFDSFLDKLDAPTVVTLEASRGYWWQHQYLSKHPKVTGVVVVDAYRSRKIAEELSVKKGYGRASNDRIDSEMLAELTRTGLAIGIHVPTPQELELRTTCRHRFELKHNRTVSANLIHSTLAMHGYSITLRELIGNEESKKKLFEQLPGYVRLIITDLVAQVQLFEKQIDQTQELL